MFVIVDSQPFIHNRSLALVFPAPPRKSKLTLFVSAFFRQLERLCDPFPPRAPRKPPRNLVGFVWHYAKPFWPVLSASAALSVAIAVTQVLLFSFVGVLIDWLTEAPSRGAFWSAHGAQIIWVGAIVLVLLPALKFVHDGFIHQGILGNFAMRTRWQTHRYLLRQSVEFYQNDFAGRVAAKMMQTSLGVRDAVIKVTEVILYVLVYFSAALVLFTKSDWRLGAPMLAWLAGYLCTLFYFVPRMRVVSMQQAEARSTVTGRAVDSYTNIHTVKMFAHAEREDNYARTGMEVFLEAVHRQMRLATLMNFTLHYINGLLFAAVGAVALWLWSGDAISVGAIAFALGLVLRLQGISEWILWEIAGLFENIGVVEDGALMIARDVAVTDRATASRLRVREGEVRFCAIGFDYGDVKPSGGVIDGVSLRVAGGEKIGVVGRSGAGKSTLVNLLLRFYDLQHGRILIDGVDIASVTQESLRAHIGMVTQDTSLLHRSVADNIRYGKVDASLDEIIACAKKARAHDFILDLKDLAGRTGYDAHVGERGVKLSGGQRQRIAIARVLLKNAPILILDEATSALDSEVEAAIQESLYNLMHGKTVIAIAHRLSTIAAMDRLVIMDQGKIVEQGDHEQLLRDGGLYAQLWARQSGGFLLRESLRGVDEVIND